MRNYLFLILIFSATIFPTVAQTLESNTLTSEEISQKMIELVKSIKTKDDISPANIERVTKLKVKFDDKNTTNFGFGGNIAGSSKWAFNLSAYSFPGQEKKETDTLNFSFNPLIDDESVIRDDYAPVCAIDFDAYSKELKDAGFSSAPYYGEHNRLLWWNFSRGAVSVQITANGENKQKENHQCVNMLLVNFSNNSINNNQKIDNNVVQNFQNKTIELFDGRNGEVMNTKPSLAETALVEKEVRVKAKENFLKKQLTGLAENIDWKNEFAVNGVVEGAFTKVNSKQKAILYRFSYTNGVVIVEDGKVVAHYSGGPGDYAFYFAIKALPDFDQNGLSEIILFRNVEDNEDVPAYLFECEKQSMKFRGETRYFASSYIAGDDTDREKAQQTAFRITVNPSKNPMFYEESYERKDDKAKWVLTKKATKIALNKRSQVTLTNIN